MVGIRALVDSDAEVDSVSNEVGCVEFRSTIFLPSL
jgi:hypothetical protein